MEKQLVSTFANVDDAELAATAIRAATGGAVEISLRPRSRYLPGAADREIPDRYFNALPTGYSRLDSSWGYPAPLNSYGAPYVSTFALSGRDHPVWRDQGGDVEMTVCGQEGLLRSAERVAVNRGGRHTRLRFH